MMKLGAVDIGSNAVRFQVTNVLENAGNVTFKKVEYVRYALRLGEDVFTNQLIGTYKEEKLTKLIQSFGLLFDVFDVSDYLVCATSAMREAENRTEVIDRIRQRTGIEIHIIDGEKEAEIVNRVIFQNLDNWNYLHIDVGGGSTELNVYRNKQKEASCSFKIGSVRSLKSGNPPEEWQNMKSWIEENVRGRLGKVVSIGTGGNIGKLYEMSKNRNGDPIPIKKLADLKNDIEKFTLEERINILLLNADRADVIIPAAEIYISVMKWAGSEQMVVPDLGLKDGIIQMLYDKNKGR